MVDEAQKTISNNYIQAFYQDVEGFKDAVANYINLFIYLDMKGQVMEEKGALDAQEIQAIHESSQKVTYFLKKCYYHLNSIPKLNNKDVAASNKIYHTIKNSYNPDRDKLEQYIISVNKVLVPMLSELNQTMGDYIDNY